MDCRFSSPLQGPLAFIVSDIDGALLGPDGIAGVYLSRERYAGRRKRATGFTEGGRLRRAPYW